MQYDISVIIEWENVLLAEQERCFRMLEQLSKQVLESTRRIEIVVMFNPGQVDRTIIEEAIGRHLTTLAEDGRRLACRIEAGPGLHYYQLKNLGIRLAHGEVIAFLDSDVIPEEGWLQALTEPFWSNPAIQVLSGHTYLDPKDLISRAFALGWFFPLRSSEPILKADSRYFFANNLAFRRVVLEGHPFPDMSEGMTRGACVMLKADLSQHGIAIWSNSAAQTSHPAPNGLAHFAARGLAQGRDWAMDREAEGIPPWRTGLRALRKFVSKPWRMFTRTLRFGRGIGLPIWQMPLVVSIMALFYLEGLLGTWAYVLAPEHSRRWWRV
ncbi:MAG: glycosyltransferase family A protein [Gallionellaceae bacterium]|nr:glycosyltransferase family A protein [Gallionellaceae bacterium]